MRLIRRTEQMLKKSSKNKKLEEVVIRNSRQTGKSELQSRILEAISKDIDVKKKKEFVDSNDDQPTFSVGSDDVDDTEPVCEVDEDGEPVESAYTESMRENAREEDALQTYRDILTMGDDERFGDSDETGSGNIRLSAPPRKIWADEPGALKYNTGDLVRLKGNNDIFKVCGPCRDLNIYCVKCSGSRDTINVHERRISKAEKGAVWKDYWSVVSPVIPAPKPWLKKEETTPTKVSVNKVIKKKPVEKSKKISKPTKSKSKKKV
jgi:hypothetical protein